MKQKNIVEDRHPKKTLTKFVPNEHKKHLKKKREFEHAVLHSKSKPNLGSVGYQQIIGHGVNTYYDIPKTDEDVEELQFVTTQVEISD